MGDAIGIDHEPRQADRLPRPADAVRDTSWAASVARGGLAGFDQYLEVKSGAWPAG